MIMNTKIKYLRRLPEMIFAPLSLIHYMINER